MREIKFRAWHKAKKFMDTAWLIDWEHGQVAHRSHNVSQLENCILMQYTGLKDKNGKEIYEGDIVLLRNEFATWKGTVIFNEGAFKLSINYSWGNSMNHFSKTDEFNDMGARIELNNTYVVVGNIYENPELLGGAGE